MTLEAVYDGNKVESILAVMPDLVSVWKVVMDNPADRCFQSPYQNTKYGAGEQDADPYAHHMTAYKSAQISQAAGFKVRNDYPLFYHFWVNRLFVLEQLNEWMEYYAYHGKRMVSCCRNLQYSHDTRAAEIRALAQQFSEGFPRVVSCVVRKEWITAIGRQHDGLAVVCRRAFFPTYPNNCVEPDRVFCKTVSPMIVARNSGTDNIKAATWMSGNSIRPMELHEQVMALC